MLQGHTNCLDWLWLLSKRFYLFLRWLWSDLISYDFRILFNRGNYIAFCDHLLCSSGHRISYLHLVHSPNVFDICWTDRPLFLFLLNQCRLGWSIAHEKLLFGWTQVILDELKFMQLLHKSLALLLRSRFFYKQRYLLLLLWLWISFSQSVIYVSLINVSTSRCNNESTEVAMSDWLSNSMKMRRIWKHLSLLRLLHYLELDILALCSIQRLLNLYIIPKVLLLMLKRIHVVISISLWLIRFHKVIVCWLLLMVCVDRFFVNESWHGILLISYRF